MIGLGYNKNYIVNSLLAGSNNPVVGALEFDSSDHIRFQDGIDVSGHNYGCHRRIEIKNNITGEDGYTVTIFNMDGIHPMWGNNVQMAPKQMKIVKVQGRIVSLVGYGSDVMGNPFSDYAIDIFFKEKEVEMVVLKLLDRNVELKYLK